MGTESVRSETALPRPYLERYPEPGGPPERVWLATAPLTIGRAESADHRIHSSVVSKVHAVLVKVDEGYAVRDLHSTNGTFVNGQRIVEQTLSDGDIVHFAQIEFCYRHPASDADLSFGDDDPALMGTQALRLTEPVSLIRSTEMLRDLIQLEAVETVFQPIVNLHSSEVIGVEALGRGTHPGSSSHPGMLLSLAEQCGMAIELSQLFRRLAVRASVELPSSLRLFLNAHPRELADFGLVDSLATLIPWQHGHTVVIEISESAVTDIGSMVRLRSGLSDFPVEFAYDDFGTGQTRLLEMTAVPPHYLKFDKTMIQGIQTAPARGEMVAALVKIADTLGIRTIAEGIETVETAAACRALGCELGQGYFICAPTGTIPRDPRLSNQKQMKSADTPRHLSRR